MRLEKVIVSFVTATLLLSASTPADIYGVNCASCHGEKGENKALGISNPIQGMEIGDFIEAVNGFATEEREGSPLAKMVKKSFVKKYSAEEIASVAKYINELK